MDHLGADEAALDVGVDLAGCTHRAGVARHGPRSTFVGAHGQHRHEIDQRVGGANEAIARGFVEAQRDRELGLIGFGHRGDVLFDLRREHHDAETALARARFERGVGARTDAGLFDIDHEQQRLLGEKRVARDHLVLFFAELEGPQRELAFEVRLDAL